jgi:hypothetical protein
MINWLTNASSLLNNFCFKKTNFFKILFIEKKNEQVKDDDDHDEIIDDDDRVDKAPKQEIPDKKEPQLIGINKEEPGVFSFILFFFYHQCRRWNHSQRWSGYR